MVAHYRTQCIFHSVTGLPEDDVVSTFYSRTNDIAANSLSAAAIGEHIINGYDAVTTPGTRGLDSFMSADVSRITVPEYKTYDADVTGSPLAVGVMVGFSVPTDPDRLPHEVAACLSFRGDYGAATEEGPNNTRPRARRRGRSFFGPLTLEAADQGTTVVRVLPDLRLSLLGFAQWLHNGNATLDALDYEWVVRSTADPLGVEYFAVTTAHVDDAFDTQRRRGVDALLRSELVL